MTRQPFLGIALPALEGDASRKGEENNARPSKIWLSSRGQRISKQSGRNRRQNKSDLINIATWNVRTMLDSSNRPRRRTALIDLELGKVKVGIAALQEVRLSGEGHLREAGRTFYWKGCPEGEPRRAGVAFVIENKLAKNLSEAPKGVSERIMTMRLNICQSRYVSIVNVYAPTMTYPEEEREAFYRQLREVLAGVPDADKLSILGDFNARVRDDHNTWRGAIGKFGRGRLNENGELLLCMCTELELAITNTYFQQPKTTTSRGNTHGPSDRTSWTMSSLDEEI